MLSTPKLREKDCIYLFPTVLYLPPMVLPLKACSGSPSYLISCLLTSCLGEFLYSPLTNSILLLSFPLLSLSYLSLFLFFLLLFLPSSLHLFYSSFLGCFYVYL